MTWKDVAVTYPEFVQWLVQTYGPLSDGEVSQDEFDSYKDAYVNYLGG